jgi:glycosidase
MRLAMIDSMKFWLDKTGIDGFRCDMAHLVVTDFWEQARPVLEEARPDLYMLAETDHYILLNKAFHSSYDWKVFHAMNEVAQGKISVTELAYTIKDQLEWYPRNASLMRFISNHDENSWQGSELERLAYFLEPMAVLYFTLPGIPLIYTGQEAGNYRRLAFFDKDLVEWKDDKMTTLYRKLALLRLKTAALWSVGEDFGYRQLQSNHPNVLAFERSRGTSKVLVILNLGYDQAQFQLLDEPTPVIYSDLFNGMVETRFGKNPCFDLAAFSYKLFYH